MFFSLSVIRTQLSVALEVQCKKRWTNSRLSVNWSLFLSQLTRSWSLFLCTVKLISSVASFSFSSSLTVSSSLVSHSFTFYTSRQVHTSLDVIRVSVIFFFFFLRIFFLSSPQFTSSTMKNKRQHTRSEWSYTHTLVQSVGFASVRRRDRDRGRKKKGKSLAEEAKQVESLTHRWWDERGSTSCSGEREETKKEEKKGQECCFLSSSSRKRHRLPTAFMMVRTCLCEQQEVRQGNKSIITWCTLLTRSLISRVDTWPKSLLLCTKVTFTQSYLHLHNRQLYLRTSSRHFRFTFAFLSLLFLFITPTGGLAYLQSANVPFVHSNWFDG